MVQSDIQLVSKAGCPFAQRTAIVLAAKDLDFALRNIDIDQKPDWFSRISPLGKVPVLHHREHALVESIAINEYLEETFPQPSLSPKTAAERARMRFWMLFDETQLTPTFYRLLMAKNRNAEKSYRGTFQRLLRLLESDGLGDDTPFLVGNNLTLADITLITHLQRLPILVEHRGVAPPRAKGPLDKWLKRMERQPAVKNASPSWKTIIEDMAPYVLRTAQGTTARDMMTVED